MQQKPTLRRALQIIVFNTVIALGIATFMGRGLWENLVYSQCIGLSIWALIDFAKYWLIKDMQTQWRRLFWLVPACAAMGYVVGTLLAQWFFPHHQLSFWTSRPNQALGFLVISLMAGAASTYFFMSREQLATAQLKLQSSQREMEAVQRQAAQAQLRLLQSQLEPHMLFNTLANLRVLITLDPPRAQQMLDHLVDYLRATLTASRATAHPLRTEFERLRDYLELIKVRMGVRLSYTLDLAPELAELPLPPLLLQALVENAIKHGLEPKLEGGSITVRASRKADRVSLVVQDTGVGLDQNADAITTDGFGLVQVRERLQTHFGPTARLELIAMKPCGTSAEATFDAKQ